jgi:DNA-binding MarR family transcriptional regulator
MTVTLTPHGEELLRAALNREPGRTPEEVLEKALKTLSEHEPLMPAHKKTVVDAITHIRESRRGVRLGGLRIKDLIHEGHKY